MIGTRECRCGYTSDIQLSEEVVRGSIFDLPRQKKAHTLMEEMKRFIEEQYKKNELTSTTLKALLRKWPEVQV